MSEDKKMLDQNFGQNSRKSESLFPREVPSIKVLPSENQDNWVQSSKATPKVQLMNKIELLIKEIYSTSTSKQSNAKRNCTPQRKYLSTYSVLQLDVCFVHHTKHS